MDTHAEVFNSTIEICRDYIYIVSIIYVKCVAIKCHTVYFITDINECETADGDVCEQLCVNNVGSFTCDCEPQYILTTDQLTCLGRHIHVQ